MKKFLSIILVVILAITATVALVGCNKDADNKWIAISDNVTNDAMNKKASVWRKGKNGFTGQEIWVGENINFDTNHFKYNTLPLDTYSLILIDLKNMDRDENYAKIKFTITVEEDCNLHFMIGKYDMETRKFSKGENVIELDYEKGMLSISKVGVAGYFSLKDDADIENWSVNHIKLLPQE